MPIALSGGATHPLPARWRTGKNICSLCANAWKTSSWLPAFFLPVPHEMLTRGWGNNIWSSPYSQSGPRLLWMEEDCGCMLNSQIVMIHTAKFPKPIALNGYVIYLSPSHSSGKASNNFTTKSYRFLIYFDTRWWSQGRQVLQLEKIWGAQGM